MMFRARWVTLRARWVVMKQGGAGVLVRTTLTCGTLAFAMDAALAAAAPHDVRWHNAFSVAHNAVLYFMLTWALPALVERTEASRVSKVCAVHPKHLLQHSTRVRPTPSTCLVLVADAAVSTIRTSLVTTVC